MRKWIWLTLALLLLMAVVVSRLRESTCIVLYGPLDRWEEVIRGILTVIPAAQVVHLSDSEADHVAYADALLDCSSHFKNIICQIPSKRCMNAIAGRTPRTTVCIDVANALLPPGITCNLVNSEQSLVDAMLPHVPAQPAGKKLLVSSATCRTPTGWTQLRATPDNLLQQINGLKFNVIMISDVSLTSLDTIYAVRAGIPQAVLLCATSSNTVYDNLHCQVTLNTVGIGTLAAAMIRMSSNYTGPQTNVVEPIVLKPVVKLEVMPAMAFQTLKTLRQL